MNTIKKSFVYNAIYQLLAIIIPLVTTPYLSRVLGETGVGNYSFHYSIAGFFVLFIMLGLNNYGNREIAKSRDEQDALREKFWGIYSFQIIMGLIVSVIYVGYIFVFSENRMLSLIMGLYVASAIFDVNWCMFGLEQFKLTTIRNIIIKLLSTVLIFIFVKTEQDVELYSIIMVGSIFLSQLSVWPYILRKIKIKKVSASMIFSHFKPNLALFLTTFAVSIYKIMDKIMLGAISGKEEVGFYESAEKIICVPIAFVSALGTVMLPRMSNLYKNGQDEKVYEIFKTSMVFSALISTILSFGIMCVSRPFVPIFYGDGFDTCRWLYLFLLPSGLFVAFANVIRTQFLIPKNYDKPYIISAFMGAITNLLFNAIFIPIFGAIGAAIGTLVAEMVVCIYQIIAASRRGLKFKPIFRRIYPAYVSGIIMFLVTYGVSYILSEGVISLVCLVGIGAVVYIIIFGMIMLIDKSTRKYYLELIKRR